MTTFIEINLWCISYFIYQFSYWKSKSTTDLIFKIDDDIDKAVECIEIKSSVLVDISKDFDTINFPRHDSHNRQYFWNILCLILDYLSNSIHFVQTASSRFFCIAHNFEINTSYLICLYLLVISRWFDNLQT